MKISKRKLLQIIETSLNEWSHDGLHPTYRDIGMGKYKSDARTGGHYKGLFKKALDKRK